MELPTLRSGILAVEDAGGKAATLSRLLAAGFRVPDGFVIPVSLAAVLTGGPSPALVEAVRVALAGLAPAGEPLAVRSSASDEDSEGASFAGQHLTVLGVSGVDGVLEAARRCVASLEGEAAASYRAARDAQRPSRMAVLVQRLIAARTAGVAFTVDPVSGDWTRITIEAVRGMGEALVSGAAAAHRFVFERDSLRLVDEDVEGERALTEAEAREVARLALACERQLGGPQDIEFAFDQSGAWLLQSRPITAAGAAAGPGEFDTPTSEADIWTSANIGEVLPGLLTPLTITAFAERGNEAYCRAYQSLRMLARDECPRFVGVFFNRAFLHVGNTRLIADRAFGSNADAVEERFLGAGKATRSTRRHTFTNVKHRFLSLIPLLRMLRTIGERGAAAERRTLAFERRLRSLNLQAMSGGELEDRRAEISELVAGTFAVHLQASGCAGAGYDMVARLVRPILGAETEGRMPVLFGGMQDVESAQIAVDLWELSRTALDAGVADDLRQPGFDPLDPGLPAAWTAAFAVFLDRHGHRGLNEMEPAQPNWRRDPSQVVRTVAGYFDLQPDASPPAVLERAAAERLELTAAVASRMNPITRRIFRRVLRDAQRWVALRERTKSVVVRGTRLVDFVIPEAARRLVVAGIIEREDDIYFLTGDELAAALRGSHTAPLQPTVLRRRRDFERNRHLRLPERFRGYPKPLPPEPAADGAVLRGTPVSPGQVTGRARVIRDPRSDGPLLPGEILVAPVTDAGWTPLFALAAGIAVDIGSALSHGSTVAREYGLPAVVNLRSATAAIRDGDLVAIDGAAGTVTIVERAG